MALKFQLELELEREVRQEEGVGVGEGVGTELQFKRGDNLLTKLEFCARNAAQHYEPHLTTHLAPPSLPGKGASNLMSCHLYKKQQSGQKVAKYLATLRAEHTRRQTERKTRRHSGGRGAGRSGRRHLGVLGNADTKLAARL